jgi:biopolymer transport protein ExbD
LLFLAILDSRHLAQNEEYAMARTNHKSPSENVSNVDMTPMLDVVFILLIFFVVTAAFVNEVGLGVNTIDDPQTERSGSSDALVVTVNSSSEIFLDGRRVDSRAVRSHLERARALNPELALLVKAHHRSTADSFVLVSEAARAANIASVSLLPVRSL